MKKYIDVRKRPDKPAAGSAGEPGVPAHKGGVSA
jgi:hypothetical protein